MAVGGGGAAAVASRLEDLDGRFNPKGPWVKGFWARGVLGAEVPNLAHLHLRASYTDVFIAQ